MLGFALIVMAGWYCGLQKSKLSKQSSKQYPQVDRNSFTGWRVRTLRANHILRNAVIGYFLVFFLVLAVAISRHYDTLRLELPMNILAIIVLAGFLLYYIPIRQLGRKLGIK